MVNIIMLMRMGVLVIFLLLAGTPAFATCTSGDNNGVATINLPSQLPVTANPAVGTVLYDSGWVLATPTINPMGCTGSYKGTFALATPGTLVSGNAVYATTIPGIGIATYFVGGTGTGYNLSNPFGVSASNGGVVTTSSICGNNCGKMGVFRTQLVVTGPISAGSMTYSGAYGTVYWSGSKIGTLTINGTTSVVDPTCDIQTTAVSVNLPTVSTHDFPANGATSGRTPFNIGLNCTGSSNVGIIMTDANNPANTSNNLTLNTGGAAGAGVQILWNNQAINFGQASPLVSGAPPVTNSAVVPVGQSPVGNWIIPFSAQYVRTGTMTSGPAVAKAVFVLTYQ